MDTVFVFAGQGSQFYGMGSRLYRENPAFRNALDRVETVIQMNGGISVKDTMMDEKRRYVEVFDDLTESSLAIFAFEYAAAMMLMEAGIRPDAVIGCSLGDITAQVMAGVLTVEEAVCLLAEQSRLFERFLQPGVCCMLAAALNAERDMTALSYPTCEVISVSHETQCVIAGKWQEIRRMAQDFRKQRIPFLELPVSYPFHTAVMEEMKEPYMRLLKKLGVGEKKPTCRMYSCAAAQRVPVLDAEYDWRVFREKIRWKECIQQMDTDNLLFVDLSPDGELALSLRYLLPNADHVYKISTAFPVKLDIETILAEIRAKALR